MTSPRARLAALVGPARFPLDKADLIALVEQAGDEGLLDVVSSLADDHYVSAEELDHRVEDALGMPDAFAERSAIVPETAWHEGEG